MQDLFRVLVAALLVLTSAGRTELRGTPRSETGSARPVCADTVFDQGTGGCLPASSKPTRGLLFPYMGEENLFSGFSFVASGRDNEARGSLACVGGGRFNKANGTLSAVGGGWVNRADGNYACVPGGYWNSATAPYATVGGGGFNGAVNRFTTVGGGNFNYAFGTAATIGGGGGNRAGPYATVAGGSYNHANGNFAAIPGGSANRAAGAFGFAAGRLAMADHAGSFVWGDGINEEKHSTAPNQFNVYASGGTRIFSDASATTGVLLAPGGGSWTSVSDEAAKENFRKVETEAVLERLADIPVTTWNYRSQEDSVRHMGPMARDFHAAFGLGHGESTIDTIDADGVALAAIQGLDRKLMAITEQKEAEIRALRRELDELRMAFQAYSTARAGTSPAATPW